MQTATAAAEAVVAARSDGLRADIQRIFEVCLHVSFKGVVATALNIGFSLKKIEKKKLSWVESL